MVWIFPDGLDTLEMLDNLEVLDTLDVLEIPVTARLPGAP
jgi:hypothetical protein